MLFWVLSLIVITALSAYFSSKINNGEKIYWIGVVSVGFLMSFLWVYVSNWSKNIIRDGLLWDVVYVAIFTLILVCCGHARDYQFKHWLGIVLTIGVFAYWVIIK